MEEEKPLTPVEDEYSAYLVCKSFKNSFKNCSIDYYNYFKNNERSEYGNEEGTFITDAK